MRGIAASVCRMPGATLAVTYLLEGEIDRLCLPAPRPPRFAHRLWQHTCFEMFIARAGEPGYHEFNFSPSGEWAAYAFACYRDDAVAPCEALDPKIAMRSAATELELDASIRLDRLSPMHCDAKLSIALSAVIEDRDGLLSYWALRHPPGKPDFHRADAFALVLDEVRN